MKFIVLSSQRSGSTLLCELLGSHPDVVMAKELFKLSGEGRNLDHKRYVPEKGSAEAFLADFFRSDDAAGIRAKGFKLMLNQFKAHVGLREFLKQEEISVIYLERRNLLKQHVSRQAARSSLLYHAEKASDGRPLVLATNNLIEQLEQMETDRDELRSLASSCNALLLTYEDLVAERNSTLEEAQRFLRLEPFSELASPLIKILSPDLNQSLANYSQVHALLDKTRFSQYLDPLIENQRKEGVESVFIHIPKVAGTSIEAALYGTFGKVGHRTAFERRRLDPIGFDRSFRFAFVRNPYDRFVSAYTYMRKGGRNKFDKEWAERNLAQFKDFDSFVFALRQPNIREAILRWMHFRPQHEFLYDAEGKILVDFVGRYETLDADFQVVSERLEMPVSLPRLNEVERDNRNEYYSDATRSIIHSLYARDFELFRYEA